MAHKFSTLIISFLYESAGSAHRVSRAREFLLAAFILIPWALQAGEFHGRILNAQGAPISDAKVSIRAGERKDAMECVSGADGTFSSADLKPGTYTITVTASAGSMSCQASIGDASSKVEIDFQLAQQSAARVAADEQRNNPNIVVYQIDLNAVRSTVDMFRGVDPQYIPSFSAEQNHFGADLGAPILRFETLAPRQSGKSWHGSAYGLYENNGLNARSFFNVGKLPPSRTGNYSLAAGGPIQFKQGGLLLEFGQNFTSGMVNGNVTVPLANERTPRASDAHINAIIATLLKAYPDELPNLPNVSLRQLNTSAQREIKSTYGSASLDLKPGKRSALSTSYFASDYWEDPYQLIKGYFPTSDLRTQNLEISWAETFDSGAAAQFGFKFNRARAFLLPSESFSSLLSPLGIASTPDIQISGSAGGGSFGRIGPGLRFPRRRVENSFYYYSNLNQNTGRHSIRLGGMVARYQVNDLQSDNSRGSLVFAPDFERSAEENFLMGTPSFYTVTLGNLYRGFRNWEYALYFQDQIRLSSTFNFNLGLRYELETNPREVNNLTNVGMRTDKNNLAPRIGFAWNAGRGKALIRAGYGISFSNIFPITYQVTRFNPPQVQILQLIAPNLVDVLTGASQQPEPGGRTTINRLSPDLAMPYSHQYNLSVEKQLSGTVVGRVTYIGSRSFHLFTRGVYNRAQPVEGIPTTTRTINQRRANPDFYEIYSVDSNAIAYYDALQISVETRLTRGLAFKASYTFSKGIDTGGDFSYTASGTESPSGFGTPSCEFCDRVSDQKGLSLYDSPHIVAVSYSYILPLWKSASPRVAALLGNWQISGMTRYQSGLPFTVTTGGDSPGTGNVDGVQGDHPNILNPSILGRTIDDPDTSTSILKREYFDTSIAPGGRGNIGVNTFRKDPVFNWNAAIQKNFRIGKAERSAQFRVEFLNLMNHAQFSVPGVNVVEETFGKMTNTMNKGRQIQFSLRLNF